MLTYEVTKAKALETIRHGLIAIEITKDHEVNKELITSIKETADLLMWLEEAYGAFEKGDLEGMRAARAKYDR